VSENSAIRRGMVRIVKSSGDNGGHSRSDDAMMRRLGKQAAGRMLDGRLHNDFPGLEVR
jgi:hypothetical protein